MALINGTSGIDIDLFGVRSLLFLPASNPRAIAKAREAGADMVVLDLEDAVKPDDKLAARSAALEAVEKDWQMPVAIRVNGVGTEWHSLDSTLPRVQRRISSSCPAQFLPISFTALPRRWASRCSR